MSKHCPGCNAYPLATFRGGELASIVIRHVDHHMGTVDPVDPGEYVPKYDPNKRSTLGSRPTREKPTRDRQPIEGAVGKTNRARTPDGRQRRR